MLCDHAVCAAAHAPPHTRSAGQMVALKRVRMDTEHEGFPLTAIREIKILKQLNHKNIVRLLEIVTAETGESGDDAREGGGIYLVFEFMDHDLTGLAESNQYGGGFPLKQIKCRRARCASGQLRSRALLCRLYDATVGGFVLLSSQQCSSSRSQGQQFAHQQSRRAENRRFRSGQGRWFPVLVLSHCHAYAQSVFIAVQRQNQTLHERRDHIVVPSARAAARRSAVRVRQRNASACGQ